MLVLDVLDADFTALVRGGCTIKFALDPNYDLTTLHVWVAPPGKPRGMSVEPQAIMQGARPSYPMIGRFSMYDPESELKEFFKDARKFLRC